MNKTFQLFAEPCFKSEATDESLLWEADNMEGGFEEIK